MRRKALSWILAVAMVISLFTALPVTANALGPQLTAGDVIRNCDFTARVKFTSDTDGHYFYAVVTDGAPEPVIDTGGMGVSCDTAEQTIYLDDLGAGDWDIYIVVKDGDGNCGEPLQLDIDSVYWGDDISVTGQYPFAGGDGSAGAPYLIDSPQQLAQLAWDIAKGIDYYHEYFQLTDDIDLAGHYWRPIGISATEEFRGYFDGDNHVVGNMTIGTADDPAMGEYMGLFGYLQNAVIHNVVVGNAAMHIAIDHDDYDYDDCYVGVLAGQGNSTDIRFCRVAGTLNVSDPDDGYVGGLVGDLDYYCDGVTGCDADVDVAFSGYSYAEVGGLIGDCSAPVIGCSATGNVSGPYRVGGLLGYAGRNVEDCYAGGNVSSSYYGGGLIGYTSGQVVNCYAAGTVYGQEYAGGLVGYSAYQLIKNCYATGAVSAYWDTREAGGLVGECYNNSGIQNSYAAGQASYLSGPVSQGDGLVSYLYTSIVTDSYWNSDLNTGSIAGTGKSTTQMQSQDFADLLNNTEATGRDESWRSWQVIEGVNNGMPVLCGVGVGLSNAPAVITGAGGVHNLAAAGEISFDCDCLGEYYYDIVAPGGTPSFDTTGSGFLCRRGTTSATLPLSSGAWDVYIVVKTLAGTVCDPVKIELSAEPALFAGGSGTEVDPYQIATPYHLHNVRYYMDKYFILTADIDLDPDFIGDAFWYDSDKGWKPIGANSPIEEPFTGEFDGNGKTVANMKVGSTETPCNDYSYLGLFDQLGDTAAVHDLGMRNFEIISTASPTTGGLAGGSWGEIDHCSVVGSISVGCSSAGGLVGANAATIKNCWADVDVQSTSWGNVGGLVGYNTGRIYNSCATGDVDGGSNARTGGLIGNNYSYNGLPAAQNCYAAGNVSGSGWGYVGAFYGQNYDDLSTAFADCYWNTDATITATSADGYTPTVHGSSDECLSVSSYDMKSSAFTGMLDEGLPAETGYYEWEFADGTNNGYPVLAAELSGDHTAPSIADDTITADDITQSGVTLTWGEASDGTTSAQALLYRLYRSGTDNLNSVSEIETNGTPVTEFGTVRTYTVSGLSSSTTYYFNVIVKDEAGNKAIYQAKNITTLSAGGVVGGGTPVTYYSIASSAGAGGSISPSGTVSVQKGQSKTFTITPERGYIVADVRVDGISAGAVSEYTFTSVSGDHTVEASFEHPSKRFTDVDGNMWYREGIDFALMAGLFNGTSDTTFEPNTGMTRAMLVTALWRLDNEPGTALTDLFADIAAGSWYTAAVAWAAGHHIVEGYDADTFGPKDPITREQMAAILYRYAGYKGYDTTAMDDLSGFSDAAITSEWALAATQWAVAEGLITGVGGTELDPAGYATRAQVATILMRFVQNIVKKSVI